MNANVKSSLSQFEKAFFDQKPFTVQKIARLRDLKSALCLRHKHILDISQRIFIHLCKRQLTNPELKVLKNVTRSEIQDFTNKKICSIKLSFLGSFRSVYLINTEFVNLQAFDTFIKHLYNVSFEKMIISGTKLTIVQQLQIVEACFQSKKIKRIEWNSNMSSPTKIFCYLKNELSNKDVTIVHYRSNKNPSDSKWIDLAFYLLKNRLKFKSDLTYIFRSVLIRLSKVKKDLNQLSTSQILKMLWIFCKLPNVLIKSMEESDDINKTLLYCFKERGDFFKLRDAWIKWGDIEILSDLIGGLPDISLKTLDIVMSLYIPGLKHLPLSKRKYFLFHESKNGFSKFSHLFRKICFKEMFSCFDQLPFSYQNKLINYLLDRNLINEIKFYWKPYIKPFLNSILENKKMKFNVHHCIKLLVKIAQIHFNERDEKNVSFVKKFLIKWTKKLVDLSVKDKKLCYLPCRIRLFACFGAIGSWNDFYPDYFSFFIRTNFILTDQLRGNKFGVGSFLLKRYGAFVREMFIRGVKLGLNVFLNENDDVLIYEMIFKRVTLNSFTPRYVFKNKLQAIEKLTQHVSESRRKLKKHTNLLNDFVMELLPYYRRLSIDDHLTILRAYGTVGGKKEQIELIYNPVERTYFTKKIKVIKFRKFITKLRDVHNRISEDDYFIHLQTLLTKYKQIKMIHDLNVPALNDLIEKVCQNEVNYSSAKRFLQDVINQHKNCLVDDMNFCVIFNRVKALFLKNSDIKDNPNLDLAWAKNPRIHIGRSRSSTTEICLANNDSKIDLKKTLFRMKSSSAILRPRSWSVIYKNSTTNKAKQENISNKKVKKRQRLKKKEHMVSCSKESLSEVAFDLKKTIFLKSNLNSRLKKQVTDNNKHNGPDRKMLKRVQSTSSIRGFKKKSVRTRQSAPALINSKQTKLGSRRGKKLLKKMHSTSFLFQPNHTYVKSRHSAPVFRKSKPKIPRLNLESIQEVDEKFEK